MAQSNFLSYLLNDVSVLEKMIRDRKFEGSSFKLGAEQELCLIDGRMNASNINLKIIKELNDPHIDTELAKYNLEVNLLPLGLKGKVFSTFEKILHDYLDKIKVSATRHESAIYLSGILPTIRHLDIDIDNITPKKRYYELVNEISKQRGNEYELRIQGEDELILRHDSVFIESATNAFQIHLEIHPDDYAKYYNIAQLIAAPIVAVSANSNLLLRKKLWHESRIALLRQSIDTVRTPNNSRNNNSRVSFGNNWVQDSVLELFREDISLHKILLYPYSVENSMEVYKNGTIPQLLALKNYNSTVYRWNRPVYGYNNGVPHLRIENRIMPAGPTVIDQVANSAFWIGMMIGIGELNIDLSKVMPFSTVKNNFIQAAKISLLTNIEWYDGKMYPIQELILDKLIPIATQGLKKLNIDEEDITNYLSIIRQRTEMKTNGAIWQYNSVKELTKNHPHSNNIYASLVKISKEYQAKNIPVHQWIIPQNTIKMDKKMNTLIVEEFMDKDLFTVRENDTIQIAADIIDWQTIRYILVENSEGQLIGLVSSRNLLKTFNKHIHHDEEIPLIIEEIMVRNPVTIESTEKLSVALDLMNKYKIGCLPVLQKNNLVGIVTEQTFLNVFSDLIESSEKG